MKNRELVQPSSVVLVSGGARGITAQCVIKLAERAHCKFILLGRSSMDVPEPEGAKDCLEETALKQCILDDLKARGEKPTLQKVQKVFKGIQAKREIEKTLQTVARAGGQAEYVQVDITNAAELQEKMAEPIHRLGRVTGIIHGAGNLADKLIEKKTVHDFETVFASKIDGLENMLRSAPVSQLQFLVLFSSIVGFYGNVGQADYAMANEILNKTAHYIQHKYPACHVVSIGWGPWDSGMVTPELKKAFEEQHVKVIPAEVGANMLVDELMPSGQHAAQVVVGNAPPHLLEESNPELRHYEIRRKLSLDANPFLYDHRIGKKAVLPATCAATWVASACEQLYPGHTFFTLENYKVLKGIVFDENLADEYILDLKEISKTSDGNIEFDSLIWSKNKQGKTLYHYSLRVKLVKEAPTAPIQESVDLLSEKNSAAISGSELYENGTLFHGPAFQGVERVLHLSRELLTMKCILPKIDEKMQGQFPVQTGNPFIYDAIVQSLLIWTQHYYQAPCLPSYMERLEQYKAIPFGEAVYVSMEVQSQTETALIADLTVQGLDGQTYVKITRLQGTISAGLNHKIGIRALQPEKI
jgi:NAD(P)-dependent dehydrogenase (short-subunit alcohol dehydrogenase family)